MSLKMERKVAIPQGSHKGEIIAARLTTKTFDPIKGPENVVEITIAPAYKVEGAQTLNVSVIYAPELNGLSGLSKFLERMDIEVPEGQEWDPASLHGRKVAFTSKTVDGFVRVLKDTIRAE